MEQIRQDHARRRQRDVERGANLRLEEVFALRSTAEESGDERSACAICTI